MSDSSEMNLSHVQNKNDFVLVKVINVADAGKNLLSLMSYLNNKIEL